MFSDFANLPDLLNALPDQAAQQLTLLKLNAVDDAHVPPFSPQGAALLLGGWNLEREKNARRWLAAVYPAAHPLKWLCPPRPASSFSLQNWQPAPAENAALYVAPLAVGYSFESFQEIIAHLRAPDGCPWDREQTHQTLRKHLLEEAYEALDALDANDPAKMREELGDLLLQIVLNAQIGSENGEFSMNEALQGIYAKIVRRHPHVFGEVQVDGVKQVLSNWEILKQEERRAKGESEKGMLDGIPLSLPALVQAQEIQARVVRVGFDWPNLDGVLDKLREEIEEVKQAKTPAETLDELGDVLFVLANLARWKGVDAEAALRAASQKFRRRFAYLENRARAEGRLLKEMSAKELDDLWKLAKRQ